MTMPASVTEDLVSSLIGQVTSTIGETYKMTEVYSGEVITALPQSSPADVAEAIEAARRAQVEWASWPVARRMKVFKRFHMLLLQHNETLVDLIQVESGKDRRMAFGEACDVPMVASHYLRRAPKLLKPVRRGGPVPLVTRSTEYRQPKGVVGIIAPWNFPLATGISDAIPALMAGNGVVLKPDNQTALSSLYGMRLLYESGLPAELFQIVCGEGPDVGPPLVDNADFVMFTGSTSTGRSIAERAGRNLVGCTLELGGKNPMILLDDVDMDDAVPGAIQAVFRNAGQVCLHIERIYVPDSIFEEFRDRFVGAAAALTLGASYDYEPDIGSLVSVEHMNRVAEHVDDARERGAAVLTGGRARPDLGPAFYEPTVLMGVTMDMLAGACETFGPVVALHRYVELDDAVRCANKSSYGLNASVWGGDLNRAAQVAAQLQAGSVNVNEGFAASYASKGTPSGGVKQSGLGVRHGDQGLLKYTDVKNVAVVKKAGAMRSAEGESFEKSVRITLRSLAIMRRIGLR